MTTPITRTLRTTMLTGLVGLSLALGACDKGDAGAKDAKKTTPAKDAKDAKGTPGDTKVAVGDDGAADSAADPAADEALDERVVKAAELAKKIEADPAKADDILAEAGMDRAAFDALLHEVSAPGLAEQYRLARSQADG